MTKADDSRMMIKGLLMVMKHAVQEDSKYLHILRGNVLMDSKCLGTSGTGTVHKMRADGVGSSAGYDWGQST